MNEPSDRPGTDFGTAWAELEPQLRRSLSSAPAHVVDDVLQETSIKLLRVWDSIDHDRPALPLAVTIARNTLRDELRRSARHTHAELSEDAGIRDDLDAVVSARLQLARIETELTHLTPGQRAALLTEVGGGSRTPDTPRVKMLRARARARLRELVAQAGGFVVTGVARLRSSAAERLAAGAPELGVLAQALLFAVVASGGAAVIADRPEVARERPRIAAAAAEHASSKQVLRVASKEAPDAQTSAAPARLTKVASPAGAVPDDGTPARPRLPTPPLPRAKGGAHDSGYFGTEGWDFAGEGGNSSGGHDVGWRYETKWESPRCVHDLAEGESPGPCEPTDRPSAAAEAEVDGQSYRVDTDGSRK